MLTRYADRTFTDQTIVLDAKRFANCRFVKCRLVYAGGELPRFDGDIKIDDSVFALDGAAHRALEFLKLIYQQGNKELVEGLLAELRGGTAH